MELSQVLQALKAADAAGNTEDARQLAAMAQQLMSAAPAQPQTKPKASMADLGYSALSGIGSLVQFPGQLYGLATGDMDNSLSKMGQSIQEYAGAQQSEGLKARQQAQQEAIKKAGEQGFLSEAGTAISTTLKDPVLFGNFIAENIPNMIPGFGATRATLGVGMRMAAKQIAEQGLEGEAKQLAMAAAQKALTKKAEALAVGTAVTQQGADVGAQAYKDLYDKQVAQGVPETEAATKALSLARSAGASGAVLSYLSSQLPGARALEQSFAGARGVKGATTGAVKGFLGESVSEGVEEGGGALARNAAMATIDPTQNILQGVGAAVGQGALLGGALGGGAGLLNSSRQAAADAQAAQQRAEANAAARQQAQAEQVAALEAKKTDPAFLSSVLDTYDQYKDKIDALKADIKANSGKNSTPLQQSQRAQATRELDALMKSPEYAQHVENVTAFGPQLDALRIQKAQAQFAKTEADLQDPVRQEALHAQRNELMGARSAAALQAQQAARSGSMQAAAQAQEKIRAIDEQLSTLQPLLGKRPPTLNESDLRARLLQLAGGTNAKGKDIQGAYTQALMAGKHDQANELLAEITGIHDKLNKMDRLRDAANQRASTLAEEEQVANEPGQSIAHAPLPAINTNALLRGVFGQQANLPSGAPAATGEKTRVAAPAPEPTTLDYQQESMFPDMEPGGNAGTQLENLRAQIDQIKNRPNVPAATLAQLDNYLRVLDNPALADTGNTRAQNALADIADNVNRIAYRGEGQGVERAASVRETKAMVAAVNKRLETIAASIEQAKADVRNAAPEEQYDRSTELRNLLRTQRELGEERQRLLNAQQVNLTPYERQQKKLVAIGAPSAVDATPEQIERARRGDKRGYGVGAVNVDPATQQDFTFQQQPGEDGETITVAQLGEERAADRMQTTDRGLARIVRPTERVVGLERAGPEDRAVAEAEAGLSERDTQTLDLWDGVFGVNSPARRTVDEAQEGLRVAQTAVAETESRLSTAQDTLLEYQQALQKAIAASPTEQRRMFLEGEELGAKRKLEQALENVRTAQQVKEMGGQTADALVKETQAAVVAAQEAAKKAEAEVDQALSAFRAEWQRAQKSGWLTPELLDFVQGRVIADDLKKASADLQRMVENNPASPATRALDMMTASKALTAPALQKMYVESMPDVRKTMGPRIAEIVDTIFKLRIADQVIGKAQTLADAYAGKQVQFNRVSQTLAEKTKDAKAAIEASGRQLSQANIRVEIARAEAVALEKQLTDMQAEIQQLLQTAPVDTAVQAARAQVETSTKDVARTATRLEQLKASQDTRITAARENLRRAKDTQQMLFENEQALREGRPMPLQTSIDDLNASIRATFDKMEASIADEAVLPTINLEDDNADLATVERQMSELNRIENSLVDLLKQHVSDFTAVQEQVETLLDTSTLLESAVFDPERENAQRLVNRAGAAAQLKALHAEEARTLTQRDAALKAIDRILETNAAVVREKSPSSEHLVRLEQQRKRLLADRAEKENLFSERLTALRDKMAALEEEYVTAPDPKLKDWGRTQIEVLRGARDRVQEQINRINDRLAAVRTNRKTVMDRQRAMGDARIKELEKLGLGKQEGTTEAKRAELTDKLVASLKHQRVEERKADAKVQSAYRRFRALRARLFGAPLRDRANLRYAAASAHRTWREAVLDRAKLQDDLVRLERMQLSLAQAITALPTKPVDKIGRSALDQFAQERGDLERAQRMYNNAYDTYDRVRDNPKSTPEQLAAAKQAWINARMRLVAADKRKTEYVNIEGRTVETTPAAEQPTAESSSTARWSGMTQALEEGAVRGPEFEEVSPEMRAFADRIYGPTVTWQGLARELGALRSAFEGEVEAFLHGKAGRTLTAKNAKTLRSNSPFARNVLQAEFKGTKRDNALDIYDKIRMLEDRIAELKEGRGPRKGEIESIAATQTKGRTGAAMKKEVLAGDWNVGDAARNAAIATGTRNPVVEKPIGKSPTSEQAIRQAEVDLAQGPLRRNMEQAKLERDLEDARQQRAEAKERADAVNASKASAAAKAKVQAQLAEAEARVKAANDALTAEVYTGKPAVFRTAVAAGPSLKIETITKVANAVMGEWTNIPPVKVVQSVADLPAYIREQAESDANTDIPGVFDPRDGVVYLVADGLSTAEDVALTIAHEVAGHYGLRDLLGNSYAKVMNDIYNSVPAIAADADARMSTTPSLTREIAVEEVLAYRAEKQAGKTGTSAALSRIFFALKSVLRSLIGRMGLKPKMLRITDAEVGQIVANARRHVKRGVTGGPRGGHRAASAQAGKNEKAPATYRTATVHDFGPYAGTPLGDLRRVEPDTRSLKERITDDAAMRAEYNLADMHNYVVAAMRQAGGQLGNQAEFDIRAAGSPSMLAEAFIQHGAPEFYTDAKGYTAIRASTKNKGSDFFEAVRALPGKDAQAKFEMMTNYMMALRGLRVGPEKVAPDMTRAQLQAVVDQVRNDPKLFAAMENARAKYNAYNDPLVDMAVKSGAISAKEGKRMTENGDYVPMYREHEGKLQASIDGKYETIGDIAHTPYLHALRGGEERVLPINETIFMNTELLTKMALVNSAKTNIGKVLAQVGKPYGKMQIGEGTGPAKTSNLTWKENGKDYHLILDTEGTPLAGIPTAMLAQSIDGYHATLPQSLLWMQKANDYLRAGVTRMPMYTLRQLIKDPASAAIIRGMEGGPLAAVARAFKEYGKIMVGKNAEMDRLSRMGLVQNSMFTGNPDDMHMLARQMAGGDAPSAIRKLLNFLDKSASAANATTQLQLYNDGLKKGLSEVEALHHAREAMNFHKRGASATVQQMNRTLVFFNSGIQALNVLQNTLRGKMPFEERLRTQQKFINNSMMLFAAGFLYAAGMGDDEEYNKLKMRDKLGNLHIPVGDTYVKLPIAYFETGGMMWAAGQALAAMAHEETDSHAVLKAMGQYALTAVPGGGGLPIGPGIRQIGEWATNKDFSTFRDIVPASKAGLAAEMQVSASTPEGMRVVANALGISPMKFQHAIESLFGSAATAGLQLLDQIAPMGDTAKTARDVTEMPFISGLFQSKTSDQAMDDMYAAANDATAAKKSLDRMKSEGRRGAEIKAYIEDNKEALVTEKLTSSFVQSMAKLTKAINVIEASDKTGEEKKALIDKLKQQKNDIAESMNKARRELVQRLDEREA